MLDARTYLGYRRKEAKFKAPNRVISSSNVEEISNSTELRKELALFPKSDDATEGEETVLVKDYTPEAYPKQ